MLFTIAGRFIYSLECILGNITVSAQHGKIGEQ
jgi:hypothetical protein